METFAARLASFDYVLYPEERRDSSAGQTRPISWPLTRPSPAELAHAGFYYNPYETNPDNTTCFLCQRALDGWEEEDNPITEHLKHSSDCGWAIMMDIQQRTSNPAEIEDPASERIAQARRATFGDNWPHEGKRGWLCQSEKMVEGGWYFCPTEESDDLASCAYCKLSLDGWEPKDDPFDEHHRRSPNCSFFVFVRPPRKKSKALKGRKPRSSKASRLSTQSVASTVSEVPTIDPESEMDLSIISQTTTKAKKSKRPSISKTRSAQVNIVSDVKLDSNIDVAEENRKETKPKTKRATRGKKRPSEEMDVIELDGSDLDKSEPSAKKRIKKSRDAVSDEENLELVDEPQLDVHAPPLQTAKKGRKPATKKLTSKNHKPTISVSESRVPRICESDAALMTDVETETELPNESISNHRFKNSSIKSKTGKKSKKNSEALNQAVEIPDVPPEPSENQALEAGDLDAPKTKAKPKRKNTGKKTKRQIESENDVLEENRKLEEAAFGDPEPSQCESLVSIEIASKPGEGWSPERNDEKEQKKISRKKTPAEQTKKQKSRVSREALGSIVNDLPKARHSSRELELQDAADGNLMGGHHDKEDKRKKHRTYEHSSRRWSSKTPPKTVERYSDIPEELQLATAVAKGRASISQEKADEHPGRDDRADAPLPSAPMATPSLSPQSSDAENRPPSTRPSTTRIPLLTPSKKETTVTNTPSSFNRNPNSRNVRSANPWTPINIDDIVVSVLNDKENVDLQRSLNEAKGELTSPEKSMTVEEWILWNAKLGEEKLKREYEKLVSSFEREGSRAMLVLDEIECID